MSAIHGQHLRHRVAVAPPQPCDAERELEITQPGERGIETAAPLDRLAPHHHGGGRLDHEVDEQLIAGDRTVPAPDGQSQVVAALVDEAAPVECEIGVGPFVEDADVTLELPRQPEIVVIEQRQSMRQDRQSRP